MSAPAVSSNGISHAYGSHVALRDISFDVPAGALFALLGPNGSGKTTLFRILTTLMPPALGTCEVGGYSTVREPHQVRRQLGIVFQEPALDDQLTVLENLQFQGALYGLSKKQRNDRIRQLTKRLEIAGRINERVTSLSGGLKRRVDLIRSLLHHPKVLILDEPTSGLDPHARRVFWDVLAEVRSTENLTVLLATHLMEEAEPADQVAILSKGVCAAIGPPDALKDRLGTSLFWVTSPDPVHLLEKLQTDYALAGDIVDGKIRLAAEDVLDRLPALFRTYPELIQEAKLKRPTLDDVFMVSTGNQLVQEATS